MRAREIVQEIMGSSPTNFAEECLEKNASAA